MRVATARVLISNRNQKQILGLLSRIPAGEDLLQRVRTRDPVGAAHFELLLFLLR